MRTRSSSNLPVESPPNPFTSNPKRRNRRRSKQPFILKESPVDMMSDQRTMAELLRAPTEGYVEAVVVPLILAEQFEFKHSLINMMTSDQFFELEKDSPHDHIRWFNKITSTIIYKDVSNSAIKHMLFPFSLVGEAHRTTNLYNEISNFQQRFNESFHEAWDRYKDLLRACPYHGLTELHQLDTCYNALNPADQDSLNSVVGGNLLERRTQDVLTIIENKSKDHAEYTIKVPPPLVKKSKPPSQRNFVMHQRDPLHPNIPYPSRMHKQKQHEKDEVQIQNFWQMFKQLNINITLADALILIPKYQKMLKALLSNTEKLLELANTPLNENCSAVILKKLPEKLRDPGKFLIPCGFSELKCKALADLGAIINLMPLSVWKKLATMTDNRTMAEMLLAPTEGCAEAIIVPPILAEQFELKHSLINMMTSEQFFGLEKDNLHDHIRTAARWLEKEPPSSITTWDDLVSKFINEFFPPSRTMNLRNEISNFQQKFDESFHEAWKRYKEILRACPHHGFTKLHQLDT
nr:reverse transcriptase domain-containing protein [Tanacetum cinerariifolium]